MGADGSEVVTRGRLPDDEDGISYREHDRNERLPQVVVSETTFSRDASLLAHGTAGIREVLDETFEENDLLTSVVLNARLEAIGECRGRDGRVHGERLARHG